MSDATKVPSIPSVTEGNAQEVARAIKQILDVREGRTGDKLDANVTFRDLVNAGLAGLQPVGGGSSSRLPIVPPSAAVDDGYDPTTDLTPPPAPLGFAAVGMFAAIKLSWLLPNIENYAYTEVWRHTENVLGNAVRIGTTPNQLYTDYVGNRQTYYYWIRFVTQADITGPYNGTNGVAATSADDPALLLELLTDEIKTDQLFPALETRINLIDAPDTTTGSVNARVKVVQDIASVKNRTFYSATAPTSTVLVPLTLGDLWFDTDDGNKAYRWTGSLWQLVTDTRVGQLVTDLSTEVTSRVGGDLAETRRRDALYAGSFAGTGNSYKIFVQATQPVGTQIGDIWSWVDPTTGTVTFSRFSGLQWVDSAANKRAAVYKGALQNPPLTDIVIGDLYFDTDTTDRKVYVWSGSTWSVKQTAIPEVAAFVYSEEVARVDADGALGQRITTVSATKTRTYYQTTAPAGTTQIPLVEGDLWFDTDDNNSVYRWSGSQWQSGRDGSIAIVDARVTNVETAKIGYCTIGNIAGDQTDKTSCLAAGGTWVVGLPLATAVKQVSVTDGTTSATLEQRFTAQKDTNNTLLAKYTVKIDIGGHVTGFGLASTTNTDAPVSEFGVRADKFFLAPPSFSSATAPTTGNYKGRAWINTSVTPNVTKYWNGTAWVDDSTALPFVINTTTSTINGVTVPAGVYIDTAFIGEATIKKAQIGSLYADRIEAGFTSSVDIESAKFSGSEFYIGGTATYEYNDTQRPTQVTGIASVAGYNVALKATGAEFDVGYFKIKNTTQNGTILVTPFEVVNNTVRIGTALIGDGTITDAKIGSEIKSTNYAVGSTGWIIKKDGTAEFGAASIRGQLTAAQIDTRNLTIKDANGTVLFGSGTKLPVAQILGLGSLATRSSVSATTGDVTGLGTLATKNDVLIGQTVKIFNSATQTTDVLGVGDFVNRLSKLNNNNISTFMENAAIGNAYIGNAAVGTLSIAGEAVFVPRYIEQVASSINLLSTFYYDPFVVVAPTDPHPGDIATLQMPISGLGPTEQVRVIVILIMQVYPGNSITTDLVYGIFANGVQNNETGATLGANGISVSSVGSFLLGNGNHLISVRVKRAAGLPDKPNNTFISRIVAMTGKR